MSTRLSMVAKIGVISVAVVGLVVLTISNQPRQSSVAAATLSVREILEPPSPAEVALALHRAGLSPERLAAAGVAPSAVGGIVQSVRDYLVEHPGLLELADTTFAQAQAAVDQLQATIQAGLGLEEDIIALGAAKSALIDATAARQSALEAVFNAGTTNLTQVEKAALGVINSNSAWELPVQYLVTNRPEAQWVQLRDALAHQSIAAAAGESADPEALLLIQQIQSENAISAATANVAANLPAIEAAWNGSIPE